MRSAHGRRGVVAVAAMLGGATVAGAQGSAPACTATPPVVNAADACTKARELFEFLAPQVGTAVSGGNFIPGEGGTLGGARFRTLSARVIAVAGQAPANDVPISISGQQASDFGARGVVIPVPTIDVALGFLPGINRGVTNVLGVDLLGGITYLPSIERDSWKVEAKRSIAFSYGARVGVLQETSIVPGLSVSFMRRKLPTISAAFTPNNDTLRVDNFALASDALRATVSKRFAIVGLAAGVGTDRIESTAAIHATLNESVVGLPQRSTLSLPLVGQRVTRRTAFLNASLNFMSVRLVGEYGMSSAGSIRETVNRFGDRKVNEGYSYGSLGVTTRF